MNYLNSIVRSVAFVICTVFMAACGGGGSSNESVVLAAPTAGVLTNAGIASISSVVLGDSVFRLSVWPGEIQEFPLSIIASTGDPFDVDITLGGATLSRVERNGKHVLVVDATAIIAGASLPYRLRLRNRVSGIEAELFGPINVLNPVVEGSGTISASGGEIVAAAINTRLVFDALPGAASLDATLSVAYTPEGVKMARVQFAQDVSMDERLMSIEELTPIDEPLQAQPRHGAGALAARNVVSEYPVIKPWSLGDGHFTEVGSFRFDPTGKRPVRNWPMCYAAGKQRICYYVVTAWDLRSTVDLPPARQTLMPPSKPIIFIHGFQQDSFDVTLNGGESYWDNFPKLVEEKILSAIAFEFRWSTNAKFELVANDLARAIDIVYARSGHQKVTLIAHSFGGILIRTLLQGMALHDASSTLSKIDQVITLGSPHSGIGDSKDSIGVGFPKGQDSPLLKGCEQISCRQIGENVSFLFNPVLRTFLGLPEREGDLAIRLMNQVGNLPLEIPIAVGIGLSLDKRLTNPGADDLAGTTVRDGDALITYKGQRFLPTLSHAINVGTSNLAKCSEISGKPIAEIILGDDLKNASLDDWYAGRSMDIPTTRRGYVHSIGSVEYGMGSFLGIYRLGNYFEPTVDLATYQTCKLGSPTGCAHAAFQVVYEAMTERICSLPVIDPISDVSAIVGGSVQFTVAARGWHRLSYEWYRQRVGGQPEIIPGKSSIVLADLTAADDGALVRVVVTNSAGQDEKSAVVHVSLDAVAPQIAADPLGASVVVGQSAVFTVVATGSQPLAYQWKRNGIDVAGATGASYTTLPTWLANNGSNFSVTVTNSGGSVNSRMATLTVTAGLVAVPVITSGPGSTAVTVGAPATFIVTVTGTQPNYEWRKGSPQSSVLAPGATNSATYVIASTTLADNGRTYFVIVSNAAGAVMSTVATLNVIAAAASSATQMTLTATPDPARPGQLVQYAATVTNRAANTQYYTITALVPNGTTVAAAAISQNVYAACSGASVCGPGSVILWGGGGHAAAVGAGQSVTVTFAALVDAANALPNGTVIRSTVAATTAEGTGSINGATAAVDVVVSTVDLSLGMVNNSSPVAPGAALSYTLRFGNPGQVSSTAAVMAVPLPAGTSFVSASDGGTLAGGVVQWNVGTISAGASGQRTLVVQVDPRAVNGSVVTTTAELRDATTGRSLARANAAAVVLTSSATQMTLTATPDPARPGQLVQYAATVTNRAANTQYYTITALVPNGTTVAAAAISQNVYAACSGASVCGPGSVILWGGGGHAAAVGAGQSVTVTFAALVDAANALPNGTVIRSTVAATTAEGTGSISGASAAVDVVIGP